MMFVKHLEVVWFNLDSLIRDSEPDHIHRWSEMR